MGKVHRVTLMPGDGIGPEVTKAAQRVIRAAGVKIDWEVVPLGMSAFEQYGSPLPQETLDSIARTKVGLKGPTGTPIGEGFRSVNVELRKRFDLYANIRPVKSIPGVPSRYENVDLVIFRENTEDFYIGEERYTGPADDTAAGAEAVSRITRFGSERIFRAAFGYASDTGRKRVTAVHKANILKLTHGIFLKAGKDIAKDYTEIAFDDRIADNMLMQLVLDPTRFDTLVAPNFIGDLMSDVCAGLVGGLGFAPGANIGDNFAIFEAVHGTAPDIAGQNKANPCALIMSAGMMLDHLGSATTLLDYLGERDAARRIDRAIRTAVKEGIFVTGDINRTNPVGTDEMTDAIIRKLQTT